jgi:hypothetical protein
MTATGFFLTVAGRIPIMSGRAYFKWTVSRKSWRDEVTG